MKNESERAVARLALRTIIVDGLGGRSSPREREKTDGPGGFRPSPVKVRNAGGVDPSAPTWSQRSHHQNSGWLLRHSVWRSRFSPIMMPKRMQAFRSPLLHR
jgi:hypothetical protein